MSDRHSARAIHAFLWEQAVKRFEEEHQCSLNFPDDVAESTAANTLNIARLDFATSLGEGRGKLKTALDSILEVISGLSKLISPALKLVYPPAEAITESIIILIEKYQQLQTNYDALSNMLDDLRFTLDRIARYSESPTPELEELVVDMFIGTLQVIRIATRTVKRSVFGKLKKFSFDDNSELKQASKDLERLSKRETKTVLAATYSTTSQIPKHFRNQQLERLKPSFVFHAPHDLCMENTRTDILEVITTWIGDTGAQNVFWLYGHPGTGKSTIAATVRSQLEGTGLLGASCFFQRDDAGSHALSAVWRSIAYDLAKASDTLFGRIVSKLQKIDPEKTHHSNIFRQLIFESLDASPSNENDSLVIILDALDEFGGLDPANHVQRDLLNTLITHWKKLPSRYKLLITSRDQGSIGSFLRTEEHRILEVGDKATEQSAKDIRTFFEFKFTEVVKELRRPGRPEWKGLNDGQLSELTRAAAGLFIYAKTVVDLVRHQPSMLETVLAQISEDKHGTIPLDDLDRLYETVLRSASEKADGKRFTLITSAICIGRLPLSSEALSRLLDVQYHDLNAIVDKLQSILDPATTLRFSHKSFIDYLISDRCPEKFRCDIPLQEQYMAMACLGVMSRELHFNMGSMPSSYLFNMDVPDLSERISEHVKYSCWFWPSHRERSMDPHIMDKMVLHFLKKQVLFWLEVMSITNRVGEAANALASLEMGTNSDYQTDARQSQSHLMSAIIAVFLISVRHLSVWLEVLRTVSFLAAVTVALGLFRLENHNIPAELTSGVRDALLFIQIFGTPISQSYPHIYISALPFSQKDSPIFRSHASYIPSTLRIETNNRRIFIPQLAEMHGHKGRVRSVAFSPDGRTIVSGSEDRTICLWDAATHQLIGEPLRGHDNWVNSITFSPDGRTIVSGSYDRTIRLWDTSTQQPIGEPLHGHDATVTSVAFSPDGRTVASGSGDCTIRLWNAATQQPIGELLRGHNSWVASINFSPDGRTIVSGSHDYTIRLWNTATQQPIREPLSGHVDYVISVAFSPDGRTIVSGSHDRTIRLWNAATHQLIGEPLRGHDNWVNSVTFSPDGRTVVSGSKDCTIRLWDTATQQPIGEPFHGHDYAINSIACSPDGRTVISGSNAFSICLWNAAATQQPIEEPLRGHNSWVTSITFSPDGRTIVSGSHDHTIRLWNAATQQPIGEPLRGHDDDVNSVAFSPDGRTIVSGSKDCTIRLWDTVTQQPIGEPLRGHEDPVNSVSFSTDGRTVVSGSNDWTIRLWDATTQQSIGEPFRGHESFVSSVAFSPDRRTVVSGSYDRSIRLWDVATRQPIGKPLLGHKDWVESVAFSPDGHMVVSGSHDCTIRLWNAATQQPIGEPLRGHDNYVNSVAFSPDGQTIVSGSWDGIIRFWDATTQQPIGKPLCGHDESITSVNFSPDGRMVLSGSQDHMISLWYATTQQRIEEPLRGHGNEVNSGAFSPDGRMVVSGSHDHTTHLSDIALSSQNAPSSPHFKDSKQIATPGLRPLSRSLHLCKDGWVRGASESERFFWIPHHLHRFVRRAGLLASFGESLVEFDFKNFVHGEEWSKCYKGVT